MQPDTSKRGLALSDALNKTPQSGSRSLPGELFEEDLRNSKVAVKSAPATLPSNRRPLRICIVTYDFYETDSRAIRYADALAQRGDEVDVFALRRRGTARAEKLFGVRVQRLQTRSFNEKSRLSYAWRVILFLTRALYHVSVNDLRKKYDVVHVLSGPDLLVFSGLLPKLRGCPLILDIRDILPEFYASKFGVSEQSLGFRFLCVVERLSAAAATHVITSNSIWRERLLSRSVRPDKCTVVLNVPDRVIFTPRREITPASDRFLLLYHGTLNWHQGLDLAIRAFANIKDQAPEADFHIYGDGTSKTELLALVQQLNLQQRVLLHDRVPMRDIPSVMETAKLGIVPKRKDRFGNEAFSTKILEFMAMGIPVIVSDTTVERLYLNDSVVRFFSGEAGDLSRCMLDLIKHLDVRTDLAQRAAEFVARNDWAHMKHGYLNLVDGLLDSAG
jgi:glycosyltransferase involved in cell wall biosynthesis